MLFSMMSIGLRGMQKSNFQRTSTTILVCNIHNQGKMSLDVFRMRYQIAGGELCSKEENKYWLLKKKEWSVLFLLSIILWASMTFREWVALDLKKNWKGNLSMSQLRSRYPH